MLADNDNQSVVANDSNEWKNGDYEWMKMKWISSDGIAQNVFRYLSIINHHRIYKEQTYDLYLKQVMVQKMR